MTYMYLFFRLSPSILEVRVMLDLDHVKKGEDSVEVQLMVIFR